MERVSTQIESESQASISRIRPELERDDSEAFQNVATCRSVSHSRVVEVCRSLSGMTEFVVDCDADIAVVEPAQTEEVALKQVFEGSTDTGGTKDQ